MTSTSQSSSTSGSSSSQSSSTPANTSSASSSSASSVTNRTSSSASQDRGSSSGKFQQALAASKVVAATNADTPCTDCADKAEVQAVILFPALGTPYVAPIEEKKIKLYLLVEDDCVEGLNHFGMKGAAENRTATLAWYFINRHLRLTPFSESTKTSATIKGNGLYSSEAVAKSAIKVWYHGRHGSGAPNTNTWSNVLRDHEGDIVATLRPSAIDFFVKAKAAYDVIKPAHQLDTKEAHVTNKPLRHLFEVELSTSGLKVPPQPDRTYSIAWFVTCVYAKTRNPKTGKPVLPGVTHWEHQDKLVYDFIAMMQKKKQHIEIPFTFDVPAITHDSLPNQSRDEGRRIKNYHPIMFKSRASLRIGHLSDVHVNSRHFALARSKASVVPNISEPIGPKITNSLVALRELFDNMHAQHADVIFITGDLIDFNHNFNPNKLVDGLPKDQWQQYDLSKQCKPANLTSGGLYPRGLDDTLVYSLVKHSYINNCPVFMLTGNHEAYDLPYGMSPRLGNFGIALTYEQTLERYKKLQHQKLNSEDSVIPERAVSAAGKLDGILSSVADQPRMLDMNNSMFIDPGAQAGAAVHDSISDGAQSLKDKLTAAKQDEYDLDYMKLANDGVAADHNLTIYEACMAYGPSAGQIVKAWNFVPANFDWFFMIFTPLADFRINYGKTLCMIGLDWGDSEVMINADMSAGEVAATGADKNPTLMAQPATAAYAMGTAAIDNITGLPRSDRSINETQKTLIQESVQGAPHGCTNILFTHFTILNYGMGQSYYTWHKNQHNVLPSRKFSIHDNVFNDYNRGTFSHNRRWLFMQHFNANGTGIHYTLSGHSHRAGAYSIDFRSDPNQAVVRACEVPLLTENANRIHDQCFPAGPQQQTRILVSSCSGPIGMQNIHEGTRGWDLRPPSGILLDIEKRGSDEFRRIIASDYEQARPRFCVFLDYLVVVGGQKIVEWEGEDKELRTLTMFIRNIPQIRPFIAEMEIHVSLKKGFVSFPCKLTLNSASGNGNDEVVYSVDITDPKGLIGRFRKNEIALVTLKFDPAAFSGHPLYSHYNFDDVWHFPISQTRSFTGKLALQRREGLFGQVPDFKTIAKKLPDYAFTPPKV